MESTLEKPERDICIVMLEDVCSDLEFFKRGGFKDMVLFKDAHNLIHEVRRILGNRYE